MNEYYEDWLHKYHNIDVAGTLFLNSHRHQWISDYELNKPLNLIPNSFIILILKSVIALSGFDGTSWILSDICINLEFIDYHSAKSTQYANSSKSSSLSSLEPVWLMQFMNCSRIS